MICRREGGFILAFAVVILMLTAGIVLHLLTEAGTRTRAAAGSWKNDRLVLAADSAARHALAAFAEGDIPLARRRLAPAMPHVLWAADWISPDGIRVTARLVDAQRRFDLNNLAPVEATGQADQEASRIAMELLRRWGDSDPGPRIAELVRALAPPIPPGEDEADAESTPPLLNWHGVIGLPGFDRSVLVAPPARPLSPDAEPIPLGRLVGFLPSHDARPVPVNINTAEEQVIRALLGSDQRPAAERMLSARGEHPFDTVEQAAASTGMAADRLAALQAWVTTRSHWFEIEARAELDGGAKTVWVLLRREATTGEVRVYQWAY